MILRRLAQNMKEQNWTAIGIEFVLLIAGVFLGIQAANWNEQRETEQKAAVFSERLIDDLRREGLRRDRQVKYYNEVRAAGKAAASALEGTTPSSNEALLVHAHRATQYMHTASQRATYDELVSTGSIALVTDRRLVALAVATYGNVSSEDLRLQRDDSPYRALFRMSVPIDIQRVLARQCGDRFTADLDAPMLDVPCQPQIEASDVDRVVEALREDPETLRLLRRRLADIDTLLSDLSRNNRSLREGLAAIAGDGP